VCDSVVNKRMGREGGVKSSRGGGGGGGGGNVMKTTKGSKIHSP